MPRLHECVVSKSVNWRLILSLCNRRACWSTKYFSESSAHIACVVWPSSLQAYFRRPSAPPEVLPIRTHLLALLRRALPYYVSRIIPPQRYSVHSVLSQRPCRPYSSTQLRWMEVLRRQIPRAMRQVLWRDQRHFRHYARSLAV